jgi:hypothetical protein
MTHCQSDTLNAPADKLLLSLLKKLGGHSAISERYVLFMAVNRKYMNETYRLSNHNDLCVFISHQKKDSSACSKIADYLKESGIDVYFDEYDSDLKIAVQSEKPKQVVNAIKAGINNSTHMLCVISPNTLYSKWVPFEVGYGYDITKVLVLTLKGIKSTDLPDYIKAVPIIRYIYDINKFIKEKKGEYILEARKFSDYSSYSHPLINLMDSIITN